MFALQFWNNNEDATDPRSVEDLAQSYLDSICKVQPHGPYLIVGYSFGGLIMLELAHRLLERGEHVAFCALLNPILIKDTGRPGTLWGSLSTKSSSMSASLLSCHHEWGLDTLRNEPNCS